MEKQLFIIFLFIFLFLTACSPSDSIQGSVHTLPESDTVPVTNETEIPSSASTTAQYIESETTTSPAPLFYTLDDNWLYNFSKNPSKISSLHIEAMENELWINDVIFKPGELKILDLSQLKECSNLTFLYIYNLADLGMTVTGWDALGGLPTLYIECINCGLTQIPISGFNNSFNKLTELYLNNNQISDLSGIALPENLRYLYLKNNPVTDIAPLFPYTKECWISLYGVNIGTDMVTQDEARKYAADYFSSITLPYFGETEKNEIYFPKFDEETYLYTDALLCYPHDNDHGLDNLTVVLCSEPKMAWMLDYGFEGSTGAFFVWVDAFTGEVLKYSAILAD